MSKAEPITKALELLGFVRDPQPKGYDAVYNLGKNNVSLQSTHGGLWVWFDNGIRIQRRYYKTDEEIKGCAQRLLTT